MGLNIKDMNYTQIQKLENLALEHKRIMQGQVNLEKLTYNAITYHSTAIAGSTLTKKQVYDLLDFDIPAKGKPFVEHQMELDHQKALIFTLNKAKKHAPLTEDLIKEIGALVVKNTGSVYDTAFGTFDSTRGDYRLLNVFAETRRFPENIKVPALMKAFVYDINDKINTAQKFRQKCELAFETHYRFASIRPFADGNGRTSRLLMNYVLAMFDLPISNVFRNNRVSYIQTLERISEMGSNLLFYNFLYHQYQKFIEKGLNVLKKN